MNRCLRYNNAEMKYTNFFLAFETSTFNSSRQFLTSVVHLHGCPDPRLYGRVYPAVRESGVLASKVDAALGGGQVRVQMGHLEQDNRIKKNSWCF